MTEPTDSIRKPDLDDDIQARLDAGETVQGPDGLAYQRLYEGLAKPDPEATLPSSFAYNVMRRILEARLGARESVATLTSILISISALAAGFCALLLLKLTGYGEAFNWARFDQLAAHVPVSLLYVASGLLLVAIIDIAVNQRVSRPAQASS